MLVAPVLVVAACGDDGGSAGVTVSSSPGETPFVSDVNIFGPAATAEQAIEKVLAQFEGAPPGNTLDEETATAERLTEEEAYLKIAELSGACPFKATYKDREVWLVLVHGHFTGISLPGTPLPPFDGTSVTLVRVDEADKSGLGGTFIPDGIEPGIPDDCDERHPTLPAGG